MIYTFTFKPITGDKLKDECITALLPIIAVRLADRIEIVTSRDLTAPELNTLTNVVSAHTAAIPKRIKAMTALYQEINALPIADKNKLFVAAATIMLQQNPRIARLLGITLDGDEPA